MNVPLIDLSRQPKGLAEAQREALLRVLDHKKFILGPEVETFEATLAEALGGGEVIGVSSGTDALLVSLMALGVRAGDRVLTTPFSFFATAGTLVRLGARPVFVDIEPDTFGMNPDALSEHDPADYRAQVPVHLFGHIMDLEPFRAWGGDGVPILEDAAQVLGSFRANGDPGGRQGALAAYSFFPTKNIGACGDAGAVFTRDPELGAAVRQLRTHGQTTRYHHQTVGGNFRLDALQAAFLAQALPHLEALRDARRANAAGYEARLEAAGLLDGRISSPAITPGHGFHQYVLRIHDGRRDAVLAGLRERGIGSAVYYPLPFHLQPCFAELEYREGQFPEAEAGGAGGPRAADLPGTAPRRAGRRRGGPRGSSALTGRGPGPALGSRPETTHIPGSNPRWKE